MDTKTLDSIDHSKLQMLATLFDVAGRVNSGGREMFVSSEIGDLVRYFRTLLSIEKFLPKDTELCSLDELRFGVEATTDDTGTESYKEGSAKKAGYIIGAIQDAVGNVPKHDPAQAKVAYEDAYSALRHFNHSDVLANATKLYKIVGKAITVLPETLLANATLFQAFFDEVEQRNDLRDENVLAEMALSFAFKHNDRSLAFGVIRGDFESGICRRFVIDNFEWICEGTSREWIIDAIFKIEEIRNDHSKIEKFLKTLSEEGKLFELFTIEISDRGRLLRGKEKGFVNYLATWVLANLPLVRDDYDLGVLAFHVGADDDSCKLMDELERRQAWWQLANIRESDNFMATKGCYAQNILDRNVNDIPTSLDLASSCDTRDAHRKIFAVIGRKGIDKVARLRAIEKIVEDGKRSEDKLYRQNARFILERIAEWIGNYADGTKEVIQKAKEVLGEFSE